MRFFDTMALQLSRRLCCRRINDAQPNLARMLVGWYLLKGTQHNECNVSILNIIQSTQTQDITPDSQTLRP